MTPDAASGKYLPSNNSECTEWLAGTGLPNLSNLWPHQEASGNFADVIGSKTLTVANAPSYRQSVPSWTRLAARTTGGAAGYWANSTFPNVNANSYTLMRVARITAGFGITRSLISMGLSFDDDATLEVNTTPRLQVGEGDGTRSIGTTDPTGAVHVELLRIDDTDNIVDGFLDGTKIVGGFRACNGQLVRVGGDNNDTWFPPTGDTLWLGLWDFPLSDSDIAVVMNRYNNGPPSVGSGHASRTQPADDTNPSRHARRTA